jgi:hypothetical protein
MTSVLLQRAAIALLLLAGVAVPAFDWIRSEPSRPSPRQLELERFIDTLATTTKAGDTVALVVPSDLTDNGYLHYRAQYLLPGRHVILGDAPGANVVATFPGGATRRR